MSEKQHNNESSDFLCSVCNEWLDSVIRLKLISIGIAQERMFLCYAFLKWKWLFNNSASSKIRNWKKINKTSKSLSISHWVLGGNFSKCDFSTNQEMQTQQASQQAVTVLKKKWDNLKWFEMKRIKNQKAQKFATNRERPKSTTRSRFE